MILLLKKYDVVIASKSHPLSRVSSPFLRKINNSIYNTIACLFLGSKVKDHQTGLKAFRRPVIKDVSADIREKRWLFDVELLYLIQKKDILLKKSRLKLVMDLVKSKDT